MPYDMELRSFLGSAETASPPRSDEVVEAARDREGVVEAYELEDNDDGFHYVIITEHPTASQRREIDDRVEEIRAEAEDEAEVSQTEDELEAYLDEVRAEAKEDSLELDKELQSLPAVVSGEGLTLVGDIRRDEPVHEIAWSPGHPGEEDHAHGAPASR